jgi:hypothetical protein
MSSRFFRFQGQRRRTAGAVFLVLALAALAFPFYYWQQAFTWFGLGKRAVPSDWFGFITGFPGWLRPGTRLPVAVAACCGVGAVLAEASRRRLEGRSAIAALILFSLSCIVAAFTLMTGGTVFAR